jgi:outer membrane receptor protein involved in Fe transport
MFLFCAGLHAAPSAGAGAVTGAVIDPATKQPVELVAVTLKTPGGAAVQSTVTDAQGRFSLEKIPPGEYVVTYNLVGADARSTAPFAVAAQPAPLDLGTLSLGDSVVKMERVEVQAGRPALLNGIDRKVYRVGQEIQSATGTASDLLQNLPSVQVDIEGNVSLRGSENVMILLDGRTSALMGKTRADVLAQLPADAIDRIEVITNPSAKFKPDGTAGIINLVLRKKADAGYAGSVTVTAGNDRRYNAGFSFNLRPGAWSFSGGYNFRQDDRRRSASDLRVITDPVTGAVVTADKTGTEHARPVIHLLRAGAGWQAGARDRFEAGANYVHRTVPRHATDRNVTRDARGAATSDYDRVRYLPELEEEIEATANWRHTFAEEDHELSLDFKGTLRRENEDNFYTNVYRLPVVTTTADNKLIHNREHGTETSLAYTRPLAGHAKLEAGYTATTDWLDANFRSEIRDPATGRFVPDPAQSNRFRTDTVIHAFYGTYARAFGKFGLLAGLRPEFTTMDSHLVTTGVTVPNDYARVYPSLHLAYQLGDRHELQWNYSHRVHRPESDDLNPFPEYIDPFNLHAGNPRLQPEDTHSFEAGYAFRQDETSFTATVYHRETYHGFTSITRNLGGGVLLNTRENLAQSRATGVEVTANAEFGKLIGLNFSSNTFFNTLDASNLGYSAHNSDVSWIAKLGASVHLPRSTLLQFNTNYSSARLTPQGYRRPSFVANTGLRHDFAAKKAAVVLTVSDVFNSLKETTVIDTPQLQQRAERRRSSRLVYLGFIYNFGKPPKKSKDDPLKFDNAL